MARPRAEQPTVKLVLRGRRFYARWWINGAWQRVSTGTEDRREAERFVAQLAAGLATPDPPPVPTVASILDGYLADRAQRVSSPETLRHACAAIKRHLGDLEPGHLTKERARFYAARRRAEGHQVGPPDRRRRKPTADGTIIREIVTLRAALKWAHGERWIDRVPPIEAPSAPPPRDRWLTRDEADRLIAEAQAPHVRLFLLLALHTAARAGALLALRWAAVDMKLGRIDLGASIGNKGRAVVPINADLLPALAEARKGATTDHVIEHGGRPVASVKTGTNAAARRAGLPGVTPHVLRHTGATWMAQDGVPMIEIARFLGHKTTATTETVYAKWSPDFLLRASRALQRKA